MLYQGIIKRPRILRNSVETLTGSSLSATTVRVRMFRCVTFTSVEGVPCEISGEVTLLVASGSCSTVIGIQIVKLLVV